MDSFVLRTTAVLLISHKSSTSSKNSPTRIAVERLFQGQ